MRHGDADQIIPNDTSYELSDGGWEHVQVKAGTRTKLVRRVCEALLARSLWRELRAS